MKPKICISVDEVTPILVREGVRNRQFRNRSHAFEQAMRRNSQ